MKDWNEDGRNEPEAPTWGWLCWVWLWREQPWITNWAHLFRHQRDTNLSAHSFTQPLSRWEQHFPELRSCKICREPLPAGDVLRAALEPAKVPRAPLSIQQALNISSSTMNCGFSGLIRTAATTLALGKGKINVLFMLGWRWGASGVPGRLENGIILNKLLMVLKALLIDYRLCS